MAQSSVPPPWPYPHLIRPHAHASGYWRLRRKGKDYYLARWDEPDAALAFYHQHIHAIARGDPVVVEPKPEPTTSPTALTLEQALNEHLDYRIESVENGDIEHKTYAANRLTARLLVRSLGRHTRVADLGPEHFGTLLRDWSQHGVFYRRKNIRTTKEMFTAIHARHGLGAPAFGPDFKAPSDRAVRKHRAAKGDHTLEPWQLLRLIVASPPRLRALIMLGINGGYGASDAAKTRCGDVDLVNARISQDRAKTGMRRCVPLWPETVEAIRDLIGGPDEPLFRTPSGRPVVRDNINNVTRQFRSVADEVGLAHVQFYDLRRTFKTIADERGDDTASKVIMGHVIRDVGFIYTQRASWARLRRHVDYVRAWLYGLTNHDHDEPDATDERTSSADM